MTRVLHQAFGLANILFQHYDEKFHPTAAAHSIFVIL